MATARLRVEAAGPLTTVQDAGRRGWMRFGVSRSGPVDSLAFRAAVAAVGAEAEEGVAIELSMGGIALRSVEGAVGFALTGPGFIAELDGVALGDWAVGTLHAGARLVVRGQVGAGNWGYLAFAGAPQVRRWLGRAATHSASGLGAGAVTAGQVLRLEGCRTLPARGLPVPGDAAAITTVRAVLGPQERFFDEADVVRLTGETFRTSGRMDRMGLVLEGPALVPTRLDMPSEAIVFGNLQVDGAGRITLLLADHQTSGGYPRIATLLARDAERVAQAPAGAAFRIKLVTAEEAVRIARAEAARQRAWLAQVADAETLEARLMGRNLITARVDEDW
jgi:allophanate hydrolase